MERVRWRAAILESFAVLVGILLAFAIDAAWDVRRQREEAHDYLTAVRGELEANLEQISEDIAYIQSVIDETFVFLETVAGFGTSPTYEETVHMVQRMSPRRPERLAQSALNDLVSSGGFGQVESAPLRRALSEYQRLLVEDDIESTDIREFFRDRLSPYLVREGSFTWDWEGYVEVPESNAEFVLPTEPFAANREYANLLTLRMLEYSHLRGSRREVAQQIEEVLRLMNGAF